MLPKTATLIIGRSVNFWVFLKFLLSIFCEGRLKDLYSFRNGNLDARDLKNDDLTGLSGVFVFKILKYILLTTSVKILQ